MLSPNVSINIPALVKCFVAGLHLIFFNEQCSYLKTCMDDVLGDILELLNLWMVWFLLEHGQLYLWVNLNYYQSILTKRVERALWKSERQNILRCWVWDGWAGISFSLNFPLW